mgnify:CR=1 FL=1
MSSTAEDLMIDPDFIQFDASLKEVEEEFEGAENTLIVKKNERIIGEIHENSLLKAMIPEEDLDEQSVVGVLGISYDSSYAPDKAEDLMNEHEVTVPLNEPLGEIALIMHREEVRSVPVVDENNEIVGVVHEDAVIEHGEVT